MAMPASIRSTADALPCGEILKDHPSDAPTIFATHSTHKLLAALSQASFIHVRDGRNAIDHARFDQSFMMHGSTSPSYPIIASNDVSASMMEGKGGEVLVEESIREAIAFRQMITRLWREHDDSGDWFFQTWNPTHVRNPHTGKQEAFEAASPDLLVSEPSCWVLHPGDACTDSTSRTTTACWIRSRSLSSRRG